jgi:hypothetical protein
MFDYTSNPDTVARIQRFMLDNWTAMAPAMRDRLLASQDGGSSVPKLRRGLEALLAIAAEAPFDDAETQEALLNLIGNVSAAIETHGYGGPAIVERATGVMSWATARLSGAEAEAPAVDPAYTSIVPEPVAAPGPMSPEPGAPAED